MRKLIEHIENLLLEHDCVIVPAFGGFVVNSQSAKIDKDNFIAPSFELGFNPLLLHNDGLLAQSLMKKFKMSFDEATCFIASEVAVLDLLLADKEAVEFGMIGLFVLENNKLIFTPNNAFVFPEMYGLSNFHCSTIKEDSHLTIKLPTTKRNLLRYSAVAIVAVVLFLTLPIPLQDAQMASVIPTQFLYSRQPKATPLKVTMAIQSTVDSITHKVDSVEPLSLSYHVIVASFIKESQAKQYISSLNGTELGKAKILSSEDKNRVCACSFSTKAEALAYLNKLKQNYPIHTAAWVLKQ